MQLTAVLWGAVMSVIMPAEILSGQVVGLGEWITLIWGTSTAILLVALPYAMLRWAVGKRLRVAIPVGLAVLIGTAALQMAVDYGGQFAAHEFLPTRIPDHSGQALLVVTTIYMMIDACNLSLFVITGTIRKIRERERELAEARVARLETELTMLRLQLNPHFLCNSLNVVSGLIVTGRTTEANQMAEGLANFLQASMDIETQSLPLAEELETVERYLEIEGARFGERLEITIDVAAGLGTVPVPSFLLQPLVENAIKHGVEAVSGESAIAIRARREDDMLVLTVENRWEGQNAPHGPRDGHGIGLANTRSRLEMVYADAASLEGGPIDRGYRATIRLPISPADGLRDAA
ncbi:MULTISPECIES: histidine kinase [unclassified Sphingomonas]|uniref:sensor histidine kinase n=1 Tax=unclassified Sphingomonas TaxID=196159 RepID=UPI00148511A3|nr:MULTISPECIES: histidine kinase [unclassified Sphingomonas]